MAPRERPQLLGIETLQRPCSFLASLFPNLPACHRANPNSEKASSSAQPKSLQNKNFHFSNSEPVAHKLGSPISTFQNLPDTPCRVESLVSYRKQKMATCSTRHGFHPHFRRISLSHSVAIPHPGKLLFAGPCARVGSEPANRRHSESPRA